MKNIKRDIFDNIDSALFKGKIIIIYGPRQVGKTTLVKEFLNKYSDKDSYFNCDEPDIREAFANKTSTELKSIIGNKKFIVIDEAQRVENIGLSLKLIVDNFPEIQILATGSSSFELANKINEPLTGRKYEFNLYPFSIKELNQLYNSIEIKRLIEERMIYGSYPGIIFESNTQKNKDLKVLADSYLFKDIFSFGNIKKPDAIIKLLKALALQIGSQVSFNELSGLIGIDKNTVESYINILEQAFIIFRVGSFSRNLRNELKFSKKIYFYDLGIRNVLINNFNSLDIRQDVGGLWENFLISERKKFLSNNMIYKNIYFWRNHEQSEIDYIEEFDGKLHTYEFKWGNKKTKIPKSFIDNYPDSTFEIINKDNFLNFLI